MARKTSFYYAFLALPAERRRAIIAVWDFCRAVDDAVDLATDEPAALAAVDRWRAEVGRVFASGAPETAEGRALQALVAPFDLAREDFDALVDGVAMDATPRTYATFADLEPYCHRVASAVGLMSVRVFGRHTPPVREYARELGVALQLTNILRDVGVDYARGRVYIPLEDLARFGCTREDIGTAAAEAGRGLRSARLRAVLDHQAARARVYFARAERALPAADAASLLAAEIMRVIYRDLLRRVETSGFDVFSRVIRVPRPAQARLALVTWWRTRRRARS